ncbi:MAG: hypothetical protein QM621_14440 [Aeromicrobium sp.]|uniref:hypothetical protein n=1 Tax=Aeromicrobium sp. TaxID=1871063 RepID=UPI0039E5ED41
MLAHQLWSLIEEIRDQDMHDWESITRTLEKCLAMRALPPKPDLPADVPAKPRVRQKTWLSDEQKADIVTAYKGGAKVKGLAKQYRVDPTTVSGILRQAGIKVKRTGLLPQEIPDAIRRYEAGDSLATISEAMGVSRATVRLRLLEHGVKMRDSHGRPR